MLDARLPACCMINGSDEALDHCKRDLEGESFVSKMDFRVEEHVLL